VSTRPNRTHLEIIISHFPLGTSKWNKVEHRLFSYITKNWQGLKVYCVRDDTEYKLARKVSNEDFATINIMKIAPNESWNYRILPQ
jgi:hypothetical protein